MRCWRRMGRFRRLCGRIEVVGRGAEWLMGGFSRLRVVASLAPVANGGS